MKIQITRDTNVTMVGSRKAPVAHCELLRRFAYQVARRGGVVRTGDAIKADEYSYRGVREFIADAGLGYSDASRLARMFMGQDVSDNGYGGIKYEHMKGHFDHCRSGPRLEMWRKARLMAADIHPVRDKLDQWSKCQHARNIFQVLGAHMDKPSDLCVFFAEPQSGRFVAGGTNTAVQCAIEHMVPRINLWHLETMLEFEAWIIELEGETL
jgi:hypothetical protein